MKREPPTAYYPVFLNISGKKCVVVGGGQIALRKVGMLLDCGAKVKVISLDFCPELGRLAENREIRTLNREYRIGDLKGALIAIAATDDKRTNFEVAKEANEKGVLVNVVDAPELSDFIVPSYLRRGEITISISTAGKSPALARKIRTKLEREFGEEYVSLIRLLGEVRVEVKRQGIKVTEDGWQEAIDLDLLIELLKKGEGEKARAVLLSSLKGKYQSG